MADSTFLYDLGIEAEDKITGFSGVVTGRCDYLTGCNQYLLQPTIDSDGKHVEGRWYDEGRLVIKDYDVKIKPESVQGNVRGACGSAPIK